MFQSPCCQSSFIICSEIPLSKGPKCWSPWDKDTHTQYDSFASKHVYYTPIRPINDQSVSHKVCPYSAKNLQQDPPNRPSFSWLHQSHIRGQPGYLLGGSIGKVPYTYSKIPRYPLPTNLGNFLTKKRDNQKPHFLGFNLYLSQPGGHLLISPGWRGFWYYGEWSRTGGIKKAGRCNSCFNVDLDGCEGWCLRMGFDDE